PRDRRREPSVDRSAATLSGSCLPPGRFRTLLPSAWTIQPDRSARLLRRLPAIGIYNQCRLGHGEQGYGGQRFVSCSRATRPGAPKWVTTGTPPGSGESRSFTGCRIAIFAVTEFMDGNPGAPVTRVSL